MAGRRRAREPEQSSNEVAQPDLARMAKIFASDLKPASEKAAKIRGDQSHAWKTIENDCHCNKRAAKALLKLMTESEELRDDFLRTFLPGLKELDLIPSEDLVDMMDGDGEKPGLMAGIVAGAKKPMGTEGMPGLQ